jgi:hypothetical protein
MAKSFRGSHDPDSKSASVVLDRAYARPFEITSANPLSGLNPLNFPTRIGSAGDEPTSFVICENHPIDLEPLQDHAGLLVDRYFFLDRRQPLHRRIILNRWDLVELLRQGLNWTTKWIRTTERTSTASVVYSHRLRSRASPARQLRAIAAVASPKTKYVVVA